jgi:predicted metal-binding membrane protein
MLREEDGSGAVALKSIIKNKKTTTTKTREFPARTSLAEQTTMMQMMMMMMMMMMLMTKLPMVMLITMTQRNTTRNADCHAHRPCTSSNNRLRQIVR